MIPLLDTSVLVRYFTFDPPHLGRRAKALIERGDPLALSTVALAETGFALTKVYEIGRDEAVDLIAGMLSRKNVVLLELGNEEAIRALQLCRPSGRVSFADALIWATALNSGNAVVYSFDRRFPSAGIDLRILDGDATPDG